MQLSYEELFSQNQVLVEQNQTLSQLLKEALEEIQNLRTEIKTLKDKVKELEDKLNTNSSNSSKPPSQDVFRPTRNKKSTGKHRGAQPGHKGHSRKLIPPEKVQITHNLKPTICPCCTLDEFDDSPVSVDVRQVIELPEIPPQVTQYNIHTCRCNGCGKHVKADIPAEAKYGFGPRLMGFITSLTGEFRLSKRQVTALAGKIGIQICSGAVCNIHARASLILKKPYGEIREHTLQQKNLNGDETSWKTLGLKRWIWSGHGDDSVFFSIKASRSSQAFQEVFGSFKGCLTTDRYGAYNPHEGERQLCWSHGDRDFEKIAGRDGFDKFIGDKLLECKKVVFDLWHKFQSKQIERDELIKKMEAGPKKDLRVLLKGGAFHPDCWNKTKSTCLDLLNRFDMLWVFIYRDGVEPTNNRAERGLRHGVIWRKLCYGSQSEIGERFAERVMTVALTLKLRAQNSFEYFTECFKAFIHGGQAPPVFSR